MLLSDHGNEVHHYERLRPWSTRHAPQPTKTLLNIPFLAFERAVSIRLNMSGAMNGVRHCLDWVIEPSIPHCANRNRLVSNARIRRHQPRLPSNGIFQSLPTKAGILLTPLKNFFL